MVSNIKSITLLGIEGKVLNIEAYLYKGLNKFTIVGLPDRSINESKDRITSAILNQNIAFPYGQLVVNLFPASLEKTGTSLDLPICLAVLLARKNIKLKINLKKTIVIGELSLTGEVKPTSSAPAMVLAAKKNGFKSIILSLEDFCKTKEIKGIEQIPIDNLNELLELIRLGSVDFLKRKSDQIQIFNKKNSKQNQESLQKKLKNIQKSRFLKLEILSNRPTELRLLGIAASGAHNLILDGPPGSGKTTMLRYFNKMLPDLSQEHALEVFKIHSLIRDIEYSECFRPIQRSPHHSISDVALIGGGRSPCPGEITLAHNGVLFLDEISEFSSYALDSLRQPLTENNINISRAKYKVNFPSRFQLVATRNPCACGWLGTDSNKCKCSFNSIKAYQNKISGALMDRIDIKYRVESFDKKNSKSIKKMQRKSRVKIINTFLEKIKLARKIQYKRFKKLRKSNSSKYSSMNNYFCNSDYDDPVNIDIFEISKKAQNLIDKLFEQKTLTLRGIFKVIQLSRTIADFEANEKVSENHVFEAINLVAWKKT